MVGIVKNIQWEAIYIANGDNVGDDRDNDNGDEIGIENRNKAFNIWMEIVLDFYLNVDCKIEIWETVSPEYLPEYFVRSTITNLWPKFV